VLAPSTRQLLGSPFFLPSIPTLKVRPLGGSSPAVELRGFLPGGALSSWRVGRNLRSV